MLMKPSRQAWFCAFSSSNAPATSVSTLSLHDALPISETRDVPPPSGDEVWSLPDGDFTSTEWSKLLRARVRRSEEHTSELQSLRHLVCRLLLEKKKRQPLAELSIDVCLFRHPHAPQRL